MKKLISLLLFSICVVLALSSCRDETENFVYKPTEVSEPPKDLVENRFWCYVTTEDVLAAEYAVTYQTKTVDYDEDEDGNTEVTYNSISTDLYKIKARRYYGWSEGLEYVSSYKETYQITAEVLSQVRRQVKNARTAICWKQAPGYGYRFGYFQMDAITGVYTL